MPPPSASPDFRFSADGVTYGAVGAPITVAAGAAVWAKIDDISNVDQVEWQVVGTDDTTTPSSYTLAQSGPKGSIVKIAAMGGLGTGLILQSTVNAGVNPATGNVDPAMTTTGKADVLAANGLHVGCYNEQFESGAQGWLSQHNAAIRMAGAISPDVNPTDNTIPVRDGTGQLRGTSFATASTGVADAGALRLVAGNQVVSAIKGASHATVALESVSGGGNTLQLGDGIEITTVDMRDAALANLGASTFAPVAEPSAPPSGWSLWADTADGRFKAKDSSGRVGILVPTIKVTNTKTFTGNNATVRTNIFQVTGAIRLVKLYGIVTTTIGANHTADQFVLYDGTTATPITAAASNPLSGASVDSIIAALGLAATPTAVVVSTGPRVGQATANQMLFQESGLVANQGATSYIGHAYTTTDTPTSGAMKYVCEYEPLSDDAAVVAV